MKRVSLVRTSLLAAALIGVASPVMADIDDPICANNEVNDPNGGCNAGPTAFEDLGALSIGGSINVLGFCGTYVPAGGIGGNTSRDLDWYKVTLTAAAKISIDIDRDDANQSTLFIFDGAGCPTGTQIFGGTIESFAPSTVFFLTAGVYTVVVTTSFEADPQSPVLACAAYDLTIAATAGDSDCGLGSTFECDVVHAGPGCDDWSCCNLICPIDPHCCLTNWDALCVQNAVDVCGYFIYSCTPGGPVGDCATAPVTLAFGATAEFNTTTANTDGPGNIVTGAGSFMGNDVWFVICAPALGEMSVTANAPFDLVVEYYNLGATAGVGDPQDLPLIFGGQADSGAEGNETIAFEAVKGNYYLIRVGGFSSAPGQPFAFGSGTVTSTLLTGEKIYDTGANNNIVGLSSGAINVGGTFAPQRWLAVPFTLTDPGAGFSGYNVTSITPLGFEPAGVTNTNLNYIFWKRIAADYSAPPVASDQLVAGSVPYPVGGSTFPMDLSGAGIELDAGNYYLTVYASDPDNGPTGTTSNFAWYVYSQDGINLIDPADGKPFAWRSTGFPSPGFQIYKGLGSFSVAAGDDPNDLYSPSFNLRGTKIPVAACPADLDSDGSVGAADLGILLGSWGGSGPGDLDGDGVVGASDLGILLGAWGPCGGG